LHRGIRRHDGVAGVRRRPHAGYFKTTAAPAHCPIAHHTRTWAALAQLRPTADAVAAAAAGRGPGQNDVVPGHDRRDSSANSFHRASALVTEDHRQSGPAHRAVHDVQTAVTDAAGGQSDQDLPWRRLVELDRVYFQRRTDPYHDCGLDE